MTIATNPVEEPENVKQIETFNLVSLWSSTLG